MEKIELAKHIKQGDTFYTPFTDPNGLGSMLNLSSWSKCWLPEFLWIGMVIHEQGREKALKNLYHIMEDLNEFEIVVPQLSKIFSLDEEKQLLFWEIVMRYVEKEILAPLTIVITPDINTVFYNIFFDFSMDIDDGISKLLSVTKKCNRFHD